MCSRIMCMEVKLLPYWSFYSLGDFAEFYSLDYVQQRDFVRYACKLMHWRPPSSSPATSDVGALMMMLAQVPAPPYDAAKDGSNRVTLNAVCEVFFNFLVRGVTLIAPYEADRFAALRLDYLADCFGCPGQLLRYHLDSKLAQRPPSLVVGGSQSVVVASMCLHWFGDDELLIIGKEVVRILEDGGVFVLKEHDYVEEPGQYLYIVLLKKLMARILGSSEQIEYLYKRRLLNVKSASCWKYFVEERMGLKVLNIRDLYPRDSSRPFLLLAQKVLKPFR
jgi:hypothetical protein